MVIVDCRALKTVQILGCYHVQLFSLWYLKAWRMQITWLLCTFKYFSVSVQSVVQRSWQLLSLLLTLTRHKPSNTSPHPNGLYQHIASHQPDKQLRNDHVEYLFAAVKKRSTLSNFYDYDEYLQDQDLNLQWLPCMKTN